jgi:hypothetical protein
MSSHQLTSEKLRKHFKNNFDLCNFSIRVARDLIRSQQPAPLQDVLDMVDEMAIKNPSVGDSHLGETKRR